MRYIPMGLMLLSGAVMANDLALQRCRAVSDATARLACYDAIVPAAKDANPAAATPGRVTAAASATTSRAPAAQTTAEFGLEARAAERNISSVSSRIAGRFEGWGPNEKIRLENGQVWQVSDGSSGFTNLNNPKVTVTRGALGTFFLDIVGTNRSPRVKRVE